MITREWVLERSRAMFAASPTATGPVEVGLHEFDLGFVVWPVEPPPADWSRPPDTIGGSVVVLDRQSGEVSFWPRLSARHVADLYRRSRAA
ncbi:hypothetical protein [Actinomadura opuntiae]|uniref:hypothetical protein n=1 Tax=Actinomadura sp. OS1-43 TaxID=604315 RepID=UPI00255B140E|nr:hypothetical protein [Actinomadura sp. OS1-43]MDL4817859.1 hypothetical protein [Actinomadura sp. OS1-43]